MSFPFLLFSPFHLCNQKNYSEVKKIMEGRLPPCTPQVTIMLPDVPKDRTVSNFSVMSVCELTHNPKD